MMSRMEVTIEREFHLLSVHRAASKHRNQNTESSRLELSRIVFFNESRIIDYFYTDCSIFFLLSSSACLPIAVLSIVVSSPRLRRATARSIIDLALLDARLTRSAHPADPLPSLGYLGPYITAAGARARSHSPGRINPGATTNGD